MRLAFNIMVLEDVRIKNKQPAKIVCVSDTNILVILLEHLGMTNVSVKWVLKMITRPPKQMRLESSPEFFDLYGEDEEVFLGSFVTVDENWISSLRT